MGHPPEGMSIGRINNNGNYEPENCKWETREQQNENTGRNKYITWKNQSKTIKQWAKEYNIAPRRVSERLRRGWSIEKTLTTPCPQGYEQGRQECLDRSRELWKQRGEAYRKNSERKKQQSQ